MSKSLYESVPLRRPAPQEWSTAPTQNVSEAPPIDRGAQSPLPVVILSGGVTGLGVLRAFSRQGIPAYVYATAPSDPIRFRSEGASL